MINYRHVSTQPYRYLYAAGHTDAHLPGSASPDSQPTGLLDALVKIDLDGGTKTVWSEPGMYPSEPVFVARESPSTPSVDADSPEDDGVVLSVVLDTAAEQSTLVMLDAASFSEIARAGLPTAFPFGFHGQWYPDGSRVHRSMP